MTTATVHNDFAGVEAPKRHHKVLNFTQSKVYGLLFCHLGKFAMVAVYFILTQWMHGQMLKLGDAHIRLPEVKQTWDHLLDSNTSHGGLVQVLSHQHWNHYRHIVRSFFEGLLAMMLFQQIGFDSMKYEKKIAEDDPTKFDRFLWRIPGVSNRFKPVSAGQQFMLPFWVLLIGTLLFVVFCFTVEPLFYSSLHWHWLEPTLTQHPPLVQKVYQDNYLIILLGIVSGFVIRRITKPVMNANMMFINRRWVAKGRKSHGWMPVGMRYAIQCLRERKDHMAYNRERLAAKGTWFAPAITFSAFALVALSAYGFYILKYIAS